MKLFSKLGMCVALLVMTSMSFGQGITTASISGSVSDAQGDGLPGAVVSAVHEPTGTRYSSVTRADGRFAILNVRVGGPYSITASMTGFNSQKKDDLFLKLGEDADLAFKLQIDSVEETLVVVAESDPLINPSKTGAAGNVSEEVIEKLPTINRSLEDFARTNPYFTNFSRNGGTSSLSVAGRPNRYNNILIDGAVNNDLFGLAASGVPGGQAEAQPINIEAIQEVQLLIAPYDVRQGGFTGGGINAITKNGTNTFTGSVFYTTRSDSFIGDGPDDRSFGDFDETFTGFTVGGPIIKDKLFFFASAESKRRERPSGFAIRPDGQDGTGINFGRNAEAVRFRDILINQYGFDPGGFDEVTRNTDSDNIFARLDWNINDNHRLTFRHNYTDAENLVIRPNGFTYEFPSHGYLFPSETNSTVLQLNSTLGEFFNEFRISFQTIEDNRGAGIQSRFPYVNVRNLPGGRAFEAGTERFSTANSLDQEILEITNDLTWFIGSHTLTVGTSNQIFSFDNLFIRENFGSYTFQSLDDFERGWAQEFNRSFSATNDPQQSAKFDASQLSFYVGDQWAVTPDLNMTLGLRLDIPLFPDDPTRNPVSEERFGLATNVTPDGNELWSPRVGFNWDINGDGKQQLRGGIGRFTGRTPFVWLSNQYSNTGIEFTRIRQRLRGEINETNNITFNPDPDNQPTNVGSTFTNEIDLIDPDFELPQVRRINLAYDRELGFFGITGTIEVIHTENINEIKYQDLNTVPTGDTFFDGRPLFENQFSDLTNVIYLTNTDEGEQTTVNLKFERPFRNGLYAMVSYLWGESTSINDGSSSQAYSNWRFNEVPGDPNNPAVNTSDFDVEHRINASLSYDFKVFGDWTTNVSFFFNAQSGGPYSTTFSSDVNGDGERSNDLLYVPRDQSEVVIQGGTWADFDAYIEADEGLRNHRGQIVPRNASREPWSHQFDLSLAQDIVFSRYKFQVTLDFFNFGNLLNDDWGEVVYANNNAVSPVRFIGFEDGTNKPIYRLNFSDPDDRFRQSDLGSRWQGKLGLRFHF